MPCGFPRARRAARSPGCCAAPAFENAGSSRPGSAEGQHLAGRLAGGQAVEGFVDLVQTNGAAAQPRSEEHTSELQSLMRISYAVFCLKKKKNNISNTKNHQHNHN